MWKVRHDQQPVVPALLDQVELDAQLLDLVCALTVRLEDLRGIEPLSLRFRDLVARGVLLTLEAFELRQQPPAPRFERGKLLELTRHVDAAVGERGTDGFDVLSEIGGIDHGQACWSLIVQQRLPADAQRAKSGSCDRMAA